MVNHQTGRPHARIICLGLFTALVIATATQHLLGQAPAAYDEIAFDATYMTKDPDTDEWKLDDKKIKALTALKNNVLLGNISLQEQSTAFNAYYTQYFFRSFSQLAQVSKLPERRRELTDDLRRSRSKEVHDAMLNESLKYMKGFATTTKKNFHPAVRYNALLVIGDLNQDEVSSAQRFPNPLPQALDFLIAEYKKPNQTESLKLAAVLGIWRHAQLDWTRPEANRIPVDRRNEITQLMLALANTKEPPAGATPDGHVWMQRRAIDVLGALGTVGPNDAVNQTLISYIHNPEADIALRCTAATTLARLNDKADKAKVTATIHPSKELLQLGALLVQACQTEMEHMKAIHTKKFGVTGAFGEFGTDGATMPGMPSSGMSGMGMSMPSGMSMAGMAGLISGRGAEGGMPAGAEMMGMMGGGSYTASGDGKDPYVDLFRRRLKYEIQCVQLGLGGVRRLSTPPPATGKKVQDPFDVMHKAIETVRTATDPSVQLAGSLPGLHKSVKDSLKDLEKLTVSVMPAPKPKPVDPNAVVDAQPAVGAAGQRAAATPVAGQAAARAQIPQGGVPQNNPAANARPNPNAANAAAAGAKPAANAAVPGAGVSIPPATNAASDAPPSIPATPPAKPAAAGTKPPAANNGTAPPPNAKK